MPEPAPVRGRLSRQLRAGAAVLVVAAAVAVMVRLSVWQWDRARARNSLMNYAYAVEWLIFAVLTVIGVVRLAVEDRRRHSPHTRVRNDQPVPAACVGAPAPVVGPPLRPGEELEEITWVRLRRRLGTAAERP